ncbi:hypothetical protein JGC56_08270 [Salmonella enterica subsp. enterica serovar Saintpaul]|nr:hypothetical protein [Salmonella enterica subsp. enterica serovar Saintpaul]
MRWFLLTVLTLCSFFAQADKCDFLPIENISEIYSFTPKSMSGTLDGSVFSSGQDSTVILRCTSKENAWLKAAMAILHSNKYAFKIGSKYYIVSFSVNYQSVDSPYSKMEYTLLDFFNMTGLVLNYTIVESSTPEGATIIAPGATIPLVTKLTLDYCQGNESKCSPKTINYNLNITIVVDITTCHFGNQEIDLGVINIKDLDKKEFEPHPVKFTCNSSGSGSLKFTPDNLLFYFEPMSQLAFDEVTLTNDYGSAANSAGSVGFQLSMDGTNSIQYGSHHLYRSDLVTGNTVPFNIYVRTRTYAGRVTAGDTMSRVKVVIDYN